MATKKDLLEAQSFSRKRLLTAFTSGAPGGKELAPANPMRTVFAGIALAAMVLIGGVFYGLMKHGLPDGWGEDHLILVEDTGERFFTRGGTLYPIINVTSALLLSDNATMAVITTSQSALDGIPIGPSIGIVGAPDYLPASGDLIPDGWTACPVTDGTAVALPGVDAVPTGDALLVTVDGHEHVVLGRFQYPVDSQMPDAALRVFEDEPLPVDSRWLNLFVGGSALTPPIVADAGLITPSGFTVGSIVTDAATELRYVVTTDDELAPLSDFAHNLYKLGSPAPVEASATESELALRTLGRAEYPVAPDDWPKEPLSPIREGEGVCAQLGHDELGIPGTTLATAQTTLLQPGVSIATQGGALVSAGGEGDQSTSVDFLVDQTGTSYAIPSASAEIIGRLGFAAEDVSAVTTEWMAFFGSGPALTEEAARATPTGGEGAAWPVEAGVSSSPTASAAPVTEGATGFTAACQPGDEALSGSVPAAFEMLQSSLAWERATGRGVTVAVVDTGIDGSHPQLAGAVVGGVNLVPDAPADAYAVDGDGHGTAVAGIVAARPVDGSGVTGLAPDANLLAVRVLAGSDTDAVRNGFGPDTDRLAEGIRWAADQDADVINVSMSVASGYPPLRQAVEHAIAAGSVVVASAGNRAEGSQAEANLYPASYPGVISVGAVDDAGAPTSSTYASSHMALAAPGQAVLTTNICGGNTAVSTEAPATSFAAAYVSASAALLKQAHAAETPAQLVYRLTATATRIDRDASGDQVGWGVPQPRDAIDLVPGELERGPDNPFTGTTAIPVPAAAVALGPAQLDTSRDAQRIALSVLAVVAGATIAVVGAMAIARRGSGDRTPNAAPESEQDGLLDQGLRAAAHVPRP